MNLDFLDHPRVRQVFSLFMLAGALMCIFPPDSYTMKWWASHAEHTALGYLCLGLLLLMVGKPRLMFVCFGCSAAIALFLNEKTNDKIKNKPATKMPFMRVAHFKASSSEGEAEDFLRTMLSSEADVISIQEITPDWDSLLSVTFKQAYPYSICISRLDPYGLSLFSKYPCKTIDTFYYQDLPNLRVSIRPEGFDRDVNIISSNIKPALNGATVEVMKGHLERISYTANQMSGPLITVGSYNTVSWSSEIQGFRAATRLKDARRGIQPSIPDGKFPLFNVPVDHIFYTDTWLESINFQTISNKFTDQAGIEATLQLVQQDSLQLQPNQ